MGIWRWLCGKILKIWGWKIVGTLPPVKKCVITVAPHTCIADFILGRLAYFSLDVEVKFLIKKEFFEYPILKQLLNKLGGLPVDRSKSNNTVSQVAAIFKKYDNLNIVIAPEGTRKLVHKWKRGYYYKAENISGNYFAMMPFAQPK
mgnify:CR=1 FL=1